MIEQTLRSATSIQGGGARYNRQSVDVEQAIEAALRNHDALIRGSGCTVERESPDSLPRVEADPAALTHCIGNLLANAARYGASGQWIGVRVAVVAASNGTPAQVTIEVADRGAGIDAQDLPHLFEPFYRGRQSRERQIQGTGLGLALVKRIMDDLGGASACARCGHAAVASLCRCRWRRRRWLRRRTRPRPNRAPREGVARRA